MLNCRRFLSRETLMFCKIAIIGANGGIGKSLAQQLKQNNRFSEISLYDITCTEGIRVDLSHINTLPEVTAHSGPDNLVKALQCSDIVVIVGGQARSKTITSREQMFEANAGLMRGFIEACIAANAQQPHIHIVTNPVNALVPIAAGILKKHGVYNPKRLSGSTSVDSMRAATFLAQHVGVDPRRIHVPVIGGHSQASIVPLISQSRPPFSLDTEEQMKIAQRIIHGGDEVALAKKQQGAAQLMLGYCVGKFCDSLVRALQGEKNVIEVAYVPANVNALPFFACHFELDREGIKEYQRLPAMVPFERELYKKAKDDVRRNIERAMEYLKKNNLA